MEEKSQQLIQANLPHHLRSPSLQPKHTYIFLSIPFSFKEVTSKHRTTLFECIECCVVVYADKCKPSSLRLDHMRELLDNTEESYSLICLFTFSLSILFNAYPGQNFLK